MEITNLLVGAVSHIMYIVQSSSIAIDYKHREKYIQSHERVTFNNE